MTAAEFVDQIKDFAVTKEDLKNADFPDEFAGMLAKGYEYKVLPKTKNSANEIINLIANYDMSSVEIGMISFDKEIRETEGFYFFGKVELDLMAISKGNNEIVVVDYSDTDEIIQYCAANSKKFLAAMMTAWRATTEFLLDEEKADDYDYREEVIAKCTELAGGDAYFDFYDNMLGD